MSRYRILYYGGPKDFSVTESYDVYGDVDAEMIESLWKYYHYIGVEAVIVREGGNLVTWELRGKLYSSDQIDRMMKLKAFS
jgi:hypothetical protein